MKQVVLILGVVVLMGSCSSTDKNTIQKEIVYSETVIETVGENKGFAESTIEIKGMSCEIMCGTAIRKGVSELAGVEIATIDFDVERESNFCTVKFDNSLLTPIEISAKIQSLNKGAYQVLSVETSKWVGKVNSEEFSSENDDKKSAYISLGDIIPSIFNVLTRVIKQ
jgi:copper chaperone CopZ